MTISSLPIAVLALQICSAAMFAGNTTFSPKIISVGSDKIQVSTGRNSGVAVKGSGASNVETYTLKPTTDIRVNGLKGSIADLTPGMSVRVSAGLDRDVASAIVANSEGPAAPSPTPRPDSGRKQNGDKKDPTLKPAYAKITGHVVVAVTGERITIAPLGGKATAYQITPRTVVKVNGVSGDIGQVTVGMTVKVAASEQTTAGRIEAWDAK